MKTFRQILAIARTEFRFAFRRGAPVAVTALIGLIVSAGTLLEPLSNLSQMPKNLNMTPEQVARLATIGLTPGEWAVFVQNMMADMFVASTVMAWLLIFTALLFLPMATSGSIPADRKFGVSEILRSMPITGSTYLAGKVLGMLAAVLLVGTVMLALFFTVTEIVLFSSLHYGLYANASWFLIKIALMDGLPMLVWGTTIGLLVGIFFRTRRAAIFPGFLAGVVSLVGWEVAFRAPAQGFFGMTDLAYYYLLQNYHSTAQAFMAQREGQTVDIFGIAGAPRVGVGQLALMYSTVVVTLALLIILARLWFQWKENF